MSDVPQGLFARRARGRRAAPRRDAQGEAFLEHYFRRIDPAVAASFTEEQRNAIKTMFGARGLARHAVEVRRSLSLGRRRFYIVLLLGNEKRSFARLYRDGPEPVNLLFYLGIGGLLLAPVLVLLLFGFHL